MAQNANQRRRKGEGSLFVSKGYYYYTFGYTVNGQQRKKKKCLGSEQEIKTKHAGWNIAVNFRNQFIADIKNGNAMTSDSENVTCDPILTQYIAHLKENQKPAAYVIEKCIEAHVRKFFGPKKISKLKTDDYKEYRRNRCADDGVSNGTVDHDLSYLRSALILEHGNEPTRVPECQRSQCRMKTTFDRASLSGTVMRRCFTRSRSR